MRAIGAPGPAPYIPPIDPRALPGGIVSSELDQMEHPLGLRRLGYAGPTLAQAALVYGPGAVTPSDEIVAEEAPVALAYNGVPHAVMMATPDDLEDFALAQRQERAPHRHLCAAVEAEQTEVETRAHATRWPVTRNVMR